MREFFEEYQEETTKYSGSGGWSGGYSDDDGDGFKSDGVTHRNYDDGWKLFEKWFESQLCSTALLCHASSPAGAFQRIFTFTKLLIDPGWLDTLSGDRSDGGTECWGNDVAVLVAAGFESIVATMLPYLRRDLVLARLCVFAIDQLYKHDDDCKLRGLCVRRRRYADDEEAYAASA
jgi:hypothetical protein